MDETNKAKKSENEFAPEQLAAWVGLDWADQEHEISLYDVATGEIESYSLKHTPEVLQEWLGKLRLRYGGHRVAIVLEQSRGAVLYALMNNDFVVLYPVNPQSLASYRKAFYPSGGKDDPVDAELLMEMVRKHSKRFRPWLPEDKETRSLRLLVEGRRKLVNQQTRLTNQITSHLKNYYPQALDLAGELNSLQACEFLRRWPTLEKLKMARPATLKKFYMSWGRPRRETIEHRVEAVAAAIPLTRDPAIVLAESMMVKALIRQLAPLIESIEQFDDEIKQLFEKHPDRSLFESFPGAGQALAPRLLAAFGADRDRFEMAAQVQNLSGIAPVIERSGKQYWVHWRWNCPKFLRQTFHEFAQQTVIYCDWAKAFYDRMREKGKGHHAAIRALAFKWIRIIFRCWKSRIPYQEGIFLEAIQRRGSELSKRAQTITELRTAKRLARRSAQIAESPCE